VGSNPTPSAKWPKSSVKLDIWQILPTPMPLLRRWTAFAFLAVSLAFCFLGVAFGAIVVWIGLAIALSRTQFATDRSLGTHCCCR
jgi:hypothetical protein